MGFIPITNKFALTKLRTVLGLVFTLSSVGVATWLGFDVTAVLTGIMIGLVYCFIAYYRGS